jgi:hypothetical protein
VLRIDPEESGLKGWLMIDGQGLLQLDAGERLLMLFAAAGRSPLGVALLRQNLLARAQVLPESLSGLPACGPALVQAAWLALLTAEQQANLARFEPLLAPLGEMNRPVQVAWPLLKEDVCEAGRTAGLSFMLKGAASAGLAFTATRLVEGRSSPAGDDHVVLAVTGDVAGEAGAKLPVNLGLAQLSASASGGTRIEFVTHHSRETLFAEAVLKSLETLGSPFSLRSASAFLQAFPHGAVQLAGKGDLRLAANFSLSGLPGPTIPGTGFIRIDASASWRGAYRTRLSLVEPGDPSHVQVEVSRSEGSETSLGVAAKVEIDTAALSRQFKDVISQARSAKGNVSTLVARLDPFFQPGTLLKARLAGLVKEWSLDPALKPVLLSIAGLSGDDEPGEILEKQIARQLNVYGKLWEASSREAAHDLLQSVQEAGGHTVLASNVALRLSSSLELLLKSLHDELQAGIRQIVSESAAYQEMIAALNALDFGLGGHCLTVDERANEVIGPVRKLLSGFQSSVSDLSHKVETYLTSRVAVQFGFGGTSASSSGLVFKAVFDARSERAGTLYARLFTDGLDESFEAMRGSPQDVELIEGQFTRVLSRSSYSVGSLNFADIALDTKAILKAQASFSIDQAGAITAHVEGSIEKEQRGLGETECVSFGNRVELQAQRTSANASVTLRIVKTDKSLRREELRAFVAPLASAGLLSVTAEPLALSSWEMWKPAGGKGIACRLGLECRLASEEILELLQLARGANGIVDGASAFDRDRVRRAAAEALVAEVFGHGSGQVLRRKMDLLLMRLSRQVEGVPADLAAGIAWVSGLAQRVDREINRHVWESLPGEAQAGAEPLQWAGDLVKGLCVALENMRRLVSLRPVASDAAGAGEITQAQALACEEDMLKALSPWVQTEGLSFRDLLGSSDRSDIAEVTLALLRTVQVLATKGRRFRDVRATLERLDPAGAKPLSPSVLIALC